MSRRARYVVFALGALGFAVLVGLAVPGLPPVGTDVHPARDTAVAGAVAHATANVVSAVNFDQRALDTLGEETILLASVVAVASLLRPAGDERLARPTSPPPVLPATRLGGWLLLPVTLLVGVDVIVNGHLTPGGAFQGGVVLASAVHLLFLTGSFDVLRRAGTERWPPRLEPAGSGLFALVGFLGLAAGAGFGANVLPVGTLGATLSSGTVFVLDLAVGLGVGAGLVHLLAHFLRQEIVVRRS